MTGKHRIDKPKSVDYNLMMFIVIMCAIAGIIAIALFT